jgi:hypothetical protein
MTDLKKCDICGRPLAQEVFFYSMFGRPAVQDEADLCSFCAREVMQYVRELKERAK